MELFAPTSANSNNQLLLRILYVQQSLYSGQYPKLLLDSDKIPERLLYLINIASLAGHGTYR